jgi:hypothetical protein
MPPAPRPRGGAVGAGSGRRRGSPCSPGFRPPRRGSLDRPCPLPAAAAATHPPERGRAFPDAPRPPGRALAGMAAQGAALQNSNVELVKCGRPQGPRGAVFDRGPTRPPRRRAGRAPAGGPDAWEARGARPGAGGAAAAVVRSRRAARRARAATQPRAPPPWLHALAARAGIEDLREKREGMMKQIADEEAEKMKASWWRRAAAALAAAAGLARSACLLP